MASSGQERPEPNSQGATKRQPCSRMRTILRSKPPQPLSYPIGLAVIASTVAGTPRFGDLDMGPSNRRWRATKFRRSLRDQEPCPLLATTYRPLGGQTPSARRTCARVASMTRLGSPALRELQAVARWLLTSDGLPPLTAWLRRARAQAGKSRRRGIELVLDPERGPLETRERGGA